MAGDVLEVRDHPVPRMDASDDAEEEAFGRLKEVAVEVRGLSLLALRWWIGDHEVSSCVA